MKVRCVNNNGYLFSPIKVKEGHNQKTLYNEISINKDYNIYGIVLYEEGLRYLIFDDYETPYWYPAELFNIIDNKVDVTWYYEFYGYEESVSAIWGYYELVFSKMHFDELAEQHQEAMDIFFKRKQEIDKNNLK